MSPRVRRALAGLAGAAVMISVITIGSRVLGFVRTLVFSSTVGVTGVGDAYATANTLPNVLFEVAAGGALAGALIPVVSGPLARGMRRDVDRIAGAMLGWALLVLGVLAVLLAVLAHPVAALFVHDPGAQRDLVATFLRVFAVQLPLYGTGVVLSGVLQAQRRFFWPAFAPVLSSVVVVVSYLVFGSLVHGAGLDLATADLGELPPAALAWLGWGTTAGVAAMSLPLLVPTWRSGVRLRPTLTFPPGVARRTLGLAGAGIGALLAQQLAVLATLRLSWSFGTDGTFSAYQQIVQAVYLLPYAVLAVPLATSTFPRLAARAAMQDRVGYARLAGASTRAVLVASTVGASALLAVAPAVAGVFGVIGQGDPTLIASTAVAWEWIAPGLLGLGLVFHVSRSLYALERGRAAVLATSLGWLAVVVASVVASVVIVPAGGDGPATLRALAMGSSIGMSVGGVALLVALRRAAGPGVLAGLGRTLGVLVVAGALAAVGGRWTADAVRDVAGSELSGSVLAAAGGGLLAAVVVLAAVWWGDRTTITGLRGADGAGGGVQS